MKILPSVIKSSHSCSVAGSNICNSNANLISFIEGVASQGGNAALMNLDLFKAYLFIFEVTFSVRQGDPIAIILFVIYIEPLIGKLSGATGGFFLCASLSI